MNKKYKKLIKKHVGIIKSRYPELYIEVEMDGDEIFISISSLEISNEVEYETLINDFIDGYDRKGFCNIFWGVDSSLTKDNLHLLEEQTSKKASA
jgi:hypothetical protein